MIVIFRKLVCFSSLLASFYLVIGQEVKDSISTIEIQEVLIKAQRKKQFSDHANYTFDKEALEQARHSKDLLTALPELLLDPISNTVASIKGGKILFLINGIEASDNQIKSIAPTNVVRVEYFDIPPSRYSQRADTVVNIITRNPEIGYSYGADITSALTTGFVNGSAYAGYTKGKNDFGLEYSINLRDYDNRIVNKIYDYNLNGIHYNSTEKQKDHLGFTNQNISLRYANVDTGNYTFQAKASMFINSDFVKGLGKSIFTQDNLLENHSTIHNSNSAYTAPTLDLYYSKNLGKKDEISLNLIGSHYTTNSSQFDQEWNIVGNTDVFNNDMNLKAKQTGIVGEISHVHSFEKGKLSSGYRISNTAIANDLVNLLGTSHYDVNYLEQYLYTEYSGKRNKLSYRFGIGITNIHNKSAETIEDNWVPNPKILLGYELSKNQMLRFYADYGIHSPNSTSLSKNIIHVVPNIFEYGNPYLKSYGDYYGKIEYSFNNKFIDINSIFFYEYKPNAFNQFFSKIDNGFGLTYENSEYTRDIGLYFSGLIKPFGNKLLVLKGFIKPTFTKIKTNDGKDITNNQILNNFVISSEYKSFYIQYQFNFPSNMLYGAFLISTENANNIFASYKLKEWAFTAGMYWLGMPSEYKTKSLPESLVDYSRISRIYNNKNMFVLGLSYDFSLGKKLQIQQKLKNATTPASTF